MNTTPNPRRSNPILLPVLTALGTTHAFDLGALIVVLDDAIRDGSSTQEKYQTEAGLLVIAFGLAVVLLVKLRKALKEGDEEALHGCATLVIVAIVGGFFAILGKTKADDGSFTEQTARSLYFFVVISVILLAPFVPASWDSKGLRRFAQVYRTMLRVIFMALLPMAFLQLLYAYAQYMPLGAINSALSPTPPHFGDNGFFVSAPWVTGLFAAWVFLSVHPTTQLDYWRFERPWIWACGFFLLGLCLIAGFVRLIYLPDHHDNAWLVDLPHDGQFLRAFGVFLLLQLPLLAMPMLAALTPRRSWLGTKGWAALAALVGGLASWSVLGLIFSPLGFVYNAAQSLAFEFAHALAAGVTTFAVLKGLSEPEQAPAKTAPA